MRLPLSMARAEALRRLLRHALLAAALVAGAVVLLSGCRQGREHVSVAGVKLPDLRTMVVPRDGLGVLAQGLEVSDSSGWKRNRAAAEDTLDPDDTGRSLAKSGRLGGYELVYSVPRSLASKHEERPLVVSTEVELFRDEVTAASYMRRQLAIALRMRGRRLPEGKIARVERFEAGDVGDEAEGLYAVLRVEDRVLYLSTVGFRRGRMLASATVVHRAEIGGAAELLRIAGTLDDRITGVASGELTEAAVELPKAKWWHAVPDPRPLTLEAGEIVGGARLTHRTYARTPLNFAFIRNYDLRRAPLGASRLIYLRTMASSFRNARDAAREQADMRSERGSDAMARAFLRAFYRGSGSRATGITARPLAAAGRDASGFRFSFDAPTGRIAGVMLGVGRGRLTANVVVLGFERELRTEDVLALRGKLLARLAPS